jgi:hypothetical protein
MITDFTLDSLTPDRLQAEIDNLKAAAAAKLIEIKQEEDKMNQLQFIGLLSIHETAPGLMNRKKIAYELRMDTLTSLRGELEYIKFEGFIANLALHVKERQLRHQLETEIKALESVKLFDA